MTQEGKKFFKDYWKEIAVILTAQLMLTFIGNFGAQKLYDYRLGAVETKLDSHIRMFEADYKPNIDILSWMHDIGIRGKEPDNENHKHKF